MSACEFTEEEKRIMREALHIDKRDTPKQSSKDEQHIGELRKLPLLEYEKRRKEFADELGVRVGVLDQMVLHRSKDDERDFLQHWNVEPWREEVDGEALLDELRNHFKRYVVLPKEADVALALWVLHTWVFECFDITPYLAITSPTPRCGKTVLMTMLHWLCCRGKKSDSMSRAVIYRSVDVEKPTLILDEVNWITGLDDERANIVNGGFERNGYAETCEGEGAAIKPKRWSTYCPKALGLIGRLTPTLMDRSIEITMRRKLPAENAERLRRRDNDEHATLRQKCRRWAEDNVDALKAAPEIVAADLNDRAVDCWEPLLIIAKQAGGEWLGRALYAAKVLSGEGHEAPLVGVELLADIRKAFGSDDALRTVDLLKDLNSDPERPWVEWRNGKPLTAKQLGTLLRPFGIISETVSIAGLDDAKGYKRIRFEDVFERYLTPQKPAPDASLALLGNLQTSKCRNADGAPISLDFSIRRQSNSDGSKNAHFSHSRSGFDASTDKNSIGAPQGASAAWGDGSNDRSSDIAFDDPEADFGPVPPVVSEPESDSTPMRAKVETAKPADDLTIPDFLDRRAEFKPGTLLTEDDEAFFESGGFK